MDVNQLQMSGRRSRLRYIVPLLLLVPVLAVAAVLVITSSSKASIKAGGDVLATIKLPTGGGTVTRVSAVGGKQQKAIAVTLNGDQVIPTGHLKQGEQITVLATVKRPGWVSWLSGSPQKLRVTETTPEAKLTSSFITRKQRAPLRVSFTHPVTVVGSAETASRLDDRKLSSSTSYVSLHESADAGTLVVSASPRVWETPIVRHVSWFPAGSHATAIADPAPGTKITPDTKIKLTFSKPVSKALDGKLPPVEPAGSGSWVRLNSRTIQFVPSGYGYGLGAHVSVSLPDGINLVGGIVHGSDPIGKWSVPNGSTESLQELLADLGYLPVTYSPGSGGSNLADEDAAQIEKSAVSTPTGSFSWRYANTPATLKSQWSPTNFTEITKGAVMAFEYANDIAVDGDPGPQVWKALINAAIKDQKSTFGYTYVYVHEAASDETETTWHDGKNVVTGSVNTGIAAAPTQLGTFAVYLRYQVTTMSGKNPDGSTYHDPGIKWVSYFNGGDALHEFPRDSYGFPQSLGCVEMPLSEAASVWPYTPIGTIVQVA